MVSRGDGALDQAVRVIERWGLLAAVTGLVANVLLLALYTVAQRNSAYEWTGPANDVIGAVSSGATIPVALALLTVLGLFVGQSQSNATLRAAGIALYPASFVGARRGRTPRLASPHYGGAQSRSSATLRVATRLAVVAMGLIVTLNVALVTDVIPFSVQAAGAGISVVAMFAWLLMVGRTGVTTGQLPGRLARAAQLMGAAVLIATPLVGLSLLLPAGSIPQYLVGGAGLLLVVPAFVAFPIWLLLLSTRLRRHLTEREASAPELTPVV
jgi:hypothetical protein